MKTDNTKRYAIIVYDDYYNSIRADALRVVEVDKNGRRPASGGAQSPPFNCGSLAKNKVAATAWAREHGFCRLSGRAY